MKLELDLRGERYEDAIIRTEKYLDDAILANYPSRVDYSWKRYWSIKTRQFNNFLKGHKRVKIIPFW